MFSVSNNVFNLIQINYVVHICIEYTSLLYSVVIQNFDSYSSTITKLYVDNNIMFP